MNLIKSLRYLVQKSFVPIDKAIYCFFRVITQVDKELIIFEGMDGRFDESSWVLYHYLRKKNKYHFVWMVRNSKQYNNTKDTKFISRYHRTFNIVADYYYAKAVFSFYTHTTSSIKYKRDGQMKIFIGHGYAIKGGKGNGRLSYNNFDYALATGVGAVKTQALFVGCEENDLLPLGLPRNDLLIMNSGKGIQNPFLRNRNFKKVILWMPTFRESINRTLSEESCVTETGLPLFDTEETIVKLNEFLNKHNCAILLKIHRLQMQKEMFKKKFTNIIMITDYDVDKTGKQLYELIGYSDALLTDYSSISVDYLLLDKPIGYILNDMDFYKKDRGFTSKNPLDVMAGEYIYEEEDCYEFILKTCNDVDDASEQRKQLIKKLHAAPKGDSCELICKYFNI